MPQFAGRSEELRLIECAINRARAGNAQVLLITGPAGIGKSHLAGTVASKLKTYSHSILDSEAQVAFGAMDRLLREQLPEYADDLIHLRTTQGVPTFAVRVVELMESFDFPYAMVLDDLNQLDTFSQEALWHIARRLDKVPVLLVGTSRDTEGWFLERLVRHIRLTTRGSVIQLGPLSAAGVRTFIRNQLFAQVSEAQLEQLMAVTGGSPIALEALVARVRHQGAESLSSALKDLALADEDGLIRKALEADESGLSEADKRALLVLALGQELRIAQFQGAVAALGLEGVNLAALRSTGLLAGSSLKVRHPRIVEVIATRATPADVVKVHSALAEVTEGLQKLHHRVQAQSGHADPALIEELLSAASNAAVVGDHELACRLVTLACTMDSSYISLACLYALRSNRKALLDELAPRIRGLLPGVERTVLDAAVAVGGIVVDELPQLDRLDVSACDDTLLLVLAHVLSTLGRTRVSIGQFAMPASMRSVEAELTQRISAAREGGLSDAELTEHIMLQGLMRLWLAASAGRGRPHDLIAATGEIAADLGRYPLARPAYAAALFFSASISHYVLEYGTAARQLETVASIPSFNSDFELGTAILRFRLAFMDGRWDEAQSVIERGLALSLDDMRDVGALEAQAASGLIPLCRGEELGVRVLDHAANAAADRQFGSAMGTVLWSLGWAAAINGDQKGVATWLAPMWANPVTGLFSGSASAVLVIHALIQLGDIPGAKATRKMLATLDLAPACRSFLLLHADALIAVGERRFGVADELFAQASLELEERGRTDSPVGLRLSAAVLAEHWAIAQRAGGRASTEASDQALEDAIELALRVGASKWRSRLERLREPVRDSVFKTASQPDEQRFRLLDQLTSREREIALLILEGRANRDIASSLFLSVRTVEYHVRNLLAKLQMTSRVELRQRLTSARRQSDHERIGG